MCADGAYIASVCLVWYIATIMRVCGARARHIYIPVSFVQSSIILSFICRDACQVLRCPLWAHRHGLSYERVLGTDGGGESDPRRTAPDINATGMVRRVDAFLSPLPRVQVRATESNGGGVCVCVCVWCCYCCFTGAIVAFCLCLRRATRFFCIGMYIIFVDSLQSNKFTFSPKCEL